MKIMALWTILLATILLIATPAAHAQADKFLTEESIRAYMEESLKSYMLDYPDYEAFLRRVSHKNFIATMDLTITLPGRDPVKNSVTMNYDEVIKAARNGYDSVQNAELEQVITEIKMTPDQQKATVAYTMTIINQSLGSAEQSTQSVMADSVTRCVDDLVFTPGTGPQVIKSACTTEVTAKPQQEL